MLPEQVRLIRSCSFPLPALYRTILELIWRPVPLETRSLYDPIAAVEPPRLHFTFNALPRRRAW